jgi:isopenicillin-N N-acyltransferase-like protein
LEKAAPNTLHRVERLRALLEHDRGALTFERMQAAVTDHAGAPYAICRHPDPKQPDAKRTMTVGAVLIDLDERVMHAANGPPCENAYVAFSLIGGA